MTTRGARVAPRSDGRAAHRDVRLARLRWLVLALAITSLVGVVALVCWAVVALVRAL